MVCNQSKKFHLVCSLLIFSTVLAMCLGGAGCSSDQVAEPSGKYEAPKRPPSEDLLPPNTGFRAPEIDLSHLTGQEMPERLVALAQALPDSWDWRTQGKVTPVKDQGDCGACYAFAAIGNIESKLLIDGAGSYDFSENNAKECDWRELSNYGCPLDCYGSCDGGVHEMLASLFSQKGVVLESCDPYVDSDVECRGTCPYQITLLDWRIICDNVVPNADVLKSYIQTYGPVPASMYVGETEGFGSYDGSFTFNYWTSPAADTDHYVLIVGWSNNLPPVPGGTGPADGWIVKNSYGPDWGDNGYFYITYGSANIGMYSSFMYDWQAYDTNGGIMYYDEDGQSDAFGYDDTTGWGLVKFFPASNTYITRVEFWTTDRTSDIDVYIYDNFDGTVLSNKLWESLNHSFNEAGYHGVTVDPPLAVNSGDDVIAVVKFTNESYLYPIPADFNGPHETGRTYSSYDGTTWFDEGNDEDDIAIRLRTSSSYTPNDPPNAPSTPSPADHATDVSLSADLSWTGGDPDAGDTVTYDVYFGTVSTPPLVSANQTETSYDPGTLSDNTTYYWQILATDNHGASTIGPLWDFTASTATVGPPWPMFQQNPQRTGRSPYSGPEVPVLEWSFTTGNYTDPSPAIGADGTIYVGSLDGNLYAINPNGSQKWSFSAGGHSWSPPTIGADGTIYVGAGGLYAINPDGSQKWNSRTRGFFNTSPAIGADGTIYVGSMEHELCAINPDGSQKWSFTTGNYVWSSPAIGADGTIYIGSDDNNLYAINPNGSQKWSFSTGGIIWVSSPAIGADGTIYVGSGDCKLYAINPDGSQKWSFTTGNEVWSSPAIGADGTIYVGSMDHKLYAINPDGSQKWSFTTEGHIWLSSPAIGADGTIYVGSGDSRLYAINPDGSQKWSFTTGDAVYSSPAIGADGTIYVGSHDNKLYAITEGFALTIASTGGGSVTSPGVGPFAYDEGTVVNLVATPNIGYHFVNWTGDVDTIADVEDATTTITMEDNYSITANFVAVYDLTISCTDGGSVTAPGDGTFAYEQGTGVSLVADADEGYDFVNWTGDVDTIANVDAASTTITINDDCSITANFEEKTSGGACFIATAAYGTPMAEEIEILREFRDEYLLTNPVGQALVDLYYMVSPPIAEFITEHPSLKPIVRAELLPAVALSALALNTTPTEKTVIPGLLVLVSVTLTIWAARRRGKDPEYT